MKFLAPHFLGFLFLAAIPVILYILFRRRKNDVDWGAFYILLRTLQSKSRRNFWKQVVILALRTILLAILVLGFARPMARRAALGIQEGAFPHGPGALHRIVLFDNSRSMAARDASTTREEAARSILRALLAGMRPGDAFNVVLLSAAQGKGSELPVLKVPCPVSRKEQLRILTRISLRGTPCDLSRGLRISKELFTGSPYPNKQLVILSDFAGKDHPNIDAYGVFGDAFAEMNVQVGALSLGARSATNLAIKSFSLGTDLLLQGQPTIAYINVVNYGYEPSASGFLALMVNGRSVFETSCVLSPHQEKLFAIPIVPGPGPLVLEARLGEDAYSYDNSYERIEKVTKQLNVLLVTRDESGISNAFERDSEFLRRALILPQEIIEKPGKLKEPEEDPVRAYLYRKLGRKIRKPSTTRQTIDYTVQYSFQLHAWPAGNLVAKVIPDSDVIMFSEVDSLNASIRNALIRFVQRGGGIILGTGPNMNLQAFNKTFAELLPACLEKPYRPVDAKLDYDRFFYIQTSGIDAPILREFETAQNGNLGDARFYNHYKLNFQKGRMESNVMLSLSNGDPILVSRRYGKGVVLLWASTIGGRWNSLVVHQAYLPFLFRILNYAAGFHVLSRNLAPGQPLVYDVTGSVGQLFLTTPTHKLIKCPRIRKRDREFIRFDDTQEPGVYSLQRQVAPGKVRSHEGNGGIESLADFYVHSSDPESDIRPLTVEMERRMLERLHIRVSDPSDPRFARSLHELKESFGGEDEGVEITTHAFLVLLLILLLDALLVRLWFS